MTIGIQLLFAPLSAARWEARLLLDAGQAVWETALVFTGICAVLALIFLFLHRREAVSETSYPLTIYGQKCYWGVFLQSVQQNSTQGAPEKRVRHNAFIIRRGACREYSVQWFIEHLITCNTSIFRGHRIARCDVVDCFWIFLTGHRCVVLCFFVMVLSACWPSQKEDELAKREQSHQFHFDAMWEC